MWHGNMMQSSYDLQAKFHPKQLVTHVDVAQIDISGIIE